MPNPFNNLSKVRVDNISVVQLLPYNTSRKAFAIAIPNLSALHIWFNPDDVSTSTGITVTLNNGFFMDYQNNGSLVWGPLFAIDAAGAFDILIAESIEGDSIADLQKASQAADVAQRVVNAALRLSDERRQNNLQLSYLFH